MPAKASQEEQMLLYRLDREVVNLPSMTNVLDESGKLAEREFGSVTIIMIVLDHRCKGAVMWGVRTEGNLNQRW
jgi:hypothetical protein